jgi:head-tail adaptor
MQAGQRDCVIAFIQAAATVDDYNATVEDWNSPTLIATRNARVRFGTAQEKREAAQEAASQTATFECVRSPVLEAMPLTARINFDGSQWDITERAPLDRKTIRFTGVRLSDFAVNISSGSASGQATVAGLV